MICCPHSSPLHQHSQRIWCQLSHIPTPGPKNQSLHRTDNVAGVGFILLTGKPDPTATYVACTISLDIGTSRANKLQHSVPEGSNKYDVRSSNVCIA